MRLLVMLLVLAASAQAQPGLLEEGTYLNHTELFQGELAPGGEVATPIAWEGAPLQQDWLLLWSGTASAPLRVSLHVDDEEIGAWDWSGGTGMTVLPASGVYELRLHNPGQTNATFSLHFDQTCDCTGKALRQPGALWFQIDAESRVPVDLRFAIVPDAVQERGHIAGTFTVRAVPDGKPWAGPVLTEVEFTIDPEDEGRLHVVDVPFEAVGGRHVVLLELEDDAEGFTYQVKPAWQLGEPRAVPVPWMTVVAAVAIAVLVRRS